MNPAVINDIMAHYGLKVAGIEPMQSGYRSQVWPLTLSDGQQITLIMHKREAGIVNRIRQTNTVGDYLWSKGVPARHSLDPRTLRLQNGITRYASLYHYLPGTTIPWEAYTMNHLKLLGWAMSDMHQQLQHFTGALPSVLDEYTAILGRMERYFHDPQVPEAVRGKLGLELELPFAGMQSVLDACRARPQQALHMDFVRGNILFQEGSGRYSLDGLELSGIIDFEKAATGPVEMDIARTLAFLLVDCKYKQAAKIQKYFLQSGYSKRGNGTYDSKLLSSLLDLFLVYDFYKFLKHNPYESLKDNEHFERTKTLLIKRRLLRVKGDRIAIT